MNVGEKEVWYSEAEVGKMWIEAGGWVSGIANASLEGSTCCALLCIRISWSLI